MTPADCTCGGQGICTVCVLAKLTEGTAGESPMKDHVLGIAARYSDAECEEHGFQKVIEMQGLTVAALMYLAEQRALRVLWIELGRDMALFKSPRIALVQLNENERKRLVILQSAILDGILIGWRARGLNDGA